jgi:hypothetical protein
MKIWKIAAVALIVVIAATLMTGSLVFAGSNDQEQVEQGDVDQEHVQREGRGSRRDGQQSQRAPRLGIVAEALDMTVEELQAEFEAGKKLPDILEELGLSQDDFEAALQAARVARIEQAVSDGDLTQEEADKILERMRERELVKDAREAMREAEIEQALDDGIITQEQADLLRELGGKGGSGRMNPGGGRPGLRGDTRAEPVLPSGGE